MAMPSLAKAYYQDYQTILAVSTTFFTCSKIFFREAESTRAARPSGLPAPPRINFRLAQQEAGRGAVETLAAADVGGLAQDAVVAVEIARPLHPAEEQTGVAA